MLVLATGETLRGVAGSASAITYTLTGDAKTTTDSFQVLAQGQLPAVAATIYTVPASTSTLMQRMFFRNTTAGVVTLSLFVNGTAGTNQIVALSLPANGSASYGADGWKIYDSNGQQLYVGAIGPTGATGATGPTGPTGATGPAANNWTTIGGNAGTATATSAGETINITGANGTTTAAANGTPDTLVITGPNTWGTFSCNTGPVIPNAGADTLSLLGVNEIVTTANDPSNLVSISIAPATNLSSGSMSGVDKRKLDNIWLDVTANTIALVNPANTAAQNITNMNLILAGAPNGTTIYFPHGLYLFNAAWTYPGATAKMFSFKGEGANKAGSPATNFTELRWTANVGGDIITLPGSGNGWYTSFTDMTFTSSATQSAGALINVNGNVGTNFTDCAFQSVATGQTWFTVLDGSGGSSNSWNSAVIDNCSFQGFTNTAIRVNSSGSSLVISNCVIQGQWGTTTQIAASCVSGGWVGALQIIGCDILGAVNNLLLNPVLAATEVCASVQCTNTYFDFAGGSCILVTGTGATVRCKWDTCTFTTSNAGAMSYSAVELAGTFAWTTGGQDLAFVNCNIYNTFGTTGTTNGVKITGVADVSFVNCKVAGWTNGYNITPITANRTNVQIIGGTVGPSGGFAGNAVGFLVAAGAYKGLQIRANNCVGNTTALTLGAVTVLEQSMFAITENAGINPRGAVTTPAVPAAGATLVNGTGFRVLVLLKCAATAPTAYNINGVAIAHAMLANQVVPITLEPGGTLSYTGTSPTWVWVGQ